MNKTIGVLAVFLLILVVSISIYFLGYRSVSVVLYGTSTSTKTAELEKTLTDLTERLGGRVNLDVVMVSSVGEGGKLSSFNANPDNPDVATFDVAENQIQHIIAQSFPDTYLEYLRLRNENLIDLNSDNYVKAAGINFDTVKRELEKGTGEELLREASNIFATLQKENDIAFVPALFINDEYYEGADDTLSLGAALVKPLLRGRREQLSSTHSLSFFNGSFVFKSPWSVKQIGGIYECYQDLDCNDKVEKDGSCASVGSDEAYCTYEEPKNVDALVINDETCVSCFTDKAKETLQKDFKGLNVREVDLDSDEAHELIDKYKIDGLPVFLFEKNVEDSRPFNRYIQNGLLALISKEDGRYVHTKTEARKLLDRPLEENTLDLFVNAYNPLTIELENKLIELKRKNDVEKKESFTIRLHHVLAIKKNDDGVIEQIPKTYGGEEETVESIRQAVIAQFFSDKLLDYIVRRNVDLKRNYEEILNELDISVQSFNNIVDQQGDTTLLENARLSAELSIQVLPVFMWENQVIVLRIEDLKKIDMFSDLDIASE